MMAAQSLTDQTETGHMIADVQALFVVAVVLGVDPASGKNLVGVLRFVRCGFRFRDGAESG
jgi:hypothetical protein